MLNKLFSSSSGSSGASARAGAAPTAAGRAGAAPAAPAAAGKGGDLIKDSSDKTFMVDVIEASMAAPVIVDFWAPWCGPCKQLGPLLEKAVMAAKGAVRLVKIDTDKHPMVASQLRVQSIPAVFAFFQGRPVDGFSGALPESQIKQFVDRLAQMGGGAAGGSLDDALTEARQLLDAHDPTAASEIYAGILQEEPEQAEAYAGLARCMIMAGDMDQARRLLDQAPKAIVASKEMSAARSILELAEQSRKTGPIPELMERLAQDKNDHETRYQLAMALFAANKREAAVDELLELVRRDREWNEQAARKQLLKFFEAFGPTDPLTLSARRRLSSILFA